MCPQTSSASPESMIDRTPDGTKIFSYVEEPAIEQSVKLTPERAGDDLVYAMSIGEEFSAIQAAGRSLFGIDGIAVSEPELRALATIFTEAADILVAANSPERAVELGAEGHGIC